MLAATFIPASQTMGTTMPDAHLRLVQLPPHCALFPLAALLLAVSPLAAIEPPVVQGPFVIDIIPRALSSEANQDSEPSLAVDPSNPAHLVATAFTPNPFGPQENTAPVFVSLDGGKTWTLRTIVPSQAPNTGTCDITVSIVAPADAHSPAALYAGILPIVDSYRMNALRAKDYLTPAPMILLKERDSADQPYVKAVGTGSGARVYLGFNVPLEGDPVGGNMTASMDVSLDGGNTFLEKPVVLERRATLNGDLPAVRPAVAPDGSVYAAFMATRSYDSTSDTLIGDVVMTRDLSGTGAFGDLKDKDGIAGVRVANNHILWQYGNYLGQQRRAGGDLALAVSPSSPLDLYLAWGEFSSAGYQIVIAKSTHGGADWTMINHSLPLAINASIAITQSGTLGLLYQQFNPDDPVKTWKTVLEQTTHDFADNIPPTVLAFAPDDPPNQGQPYLGDYTALTAVGDSFLGVFSTNNRPVPERFPAVMPVYQRNVDTEQRALIGQGFVSTARAVSVSATDNSYNCTTCDFVADGFVAGELIQGEGFSKAANNALSRIGAVTRLKITTSGRLADESAGTRVIRSFHHVDDSIDPFFFRVTAVH
jgi:hypothetical protein